MQVTFPRTLGGLALIWAVGGTLTPGWANAQVWLGATLGLVVAGVWLLTGRHVPVGAWLLAGGCAVQLLGSPGEPVYPAALLGWAGLIVGVTEGRPWERAILLRVCVSCVYAFTALAKLNPVYLAGDQIVWLTVTRPHLAWAFDLASGPAGVGLAWTAVALEGWLAIGLWLPRTRAATAVLGSMLHATFIPAAAFGLISVPFLIVLNFGLVAMYPAFWARQQEGHEHSLGPTYGVG